MTYAIRNTSTGWFLGVNTKYEKNAEWDNIAVFELHDAHEQLDILGGDEWEMVPM
jgi:hypothetical protein